MSKFNQYIVVQRIDFLDCQLFVYLLLLSFGCCRIWYFDALYIDTRFFQPMEIYVDDETKLTFHGLVQVSSMLFFLQYFCFIS